MKSIARSHHSVEMKYVERELLESGDAAMRAVGHELHNDIAQQLVGISFLLKGLKGKLRMMGLDETDDLELAEIELNQTARQVLNLARRLTPLEMAGGDFISSMETLAFHTQRIHSIRCQFQTEGKVPDLKKKEAWHLHNIVQVALSDAMEDDKASCASISLATSPNRLILILRNDGLIFPSLSAWCKGKRLSILDQRARSIGAFIDLSPRQQGGTLLVCALPLKT